MLLPVHDAVRDSYRGVAVGPSAEGAATFQLETDSLHSNRLPPELLQLDQQLLLFAKRLGVAAAPTAMAACLAMVGDLDSHVPPASMAADAAAAGANRGSSLGCRLAPHPSDLRIALSVRHSYALPVQGEASGEWLVRARRMPLPHCLHVACSTVSSLACHVKHRFRLPCFGLCCTLRCCFAGARRWR